MLIETDSKLLLLLLPSARPQEIVLSCSAICGTMESAHCKWNTGRESEVEFGVISTASTVDQRLLYSTLWSVMTLIWWTRSYHNNRTTYLIELKESTEKSWGRPVLAVCRFGCRLLSYSNYSFALFLFRLVSGLKCAAVLCVAEAEVGLLLWWWWQWSWWWSAKERRAKNRSQLN